MKLPLLAISLVLFAAPTFAADVDGKWTGSVDSPNGPIAVTYLLKTDGATLTGTTTGPDGSSLALKNGKVAGDKISFSVDFDLGGDKTTFDFTGVVSATEIKLHSEFMGQAIDYSVKKAG